MRYLVTGSAGHLGEGLVRTLRDRPGDEVIGLDIQASPFTDVIASVADRGSVEDCLSGIDVVLHTATLHKPHVATHPAQAFVDTNVTGTLTLLEAAAEQGVRAFVFTSTTSVYGEAMHSEVGEPAVWVTESTVPRPKNIYGITKLAAEALCRLARRQQDLPCVVLRTSRFFPEQDDDRRRRAQFADANIKANEFLYRRVELADVVSAHLLAAEHTESLDFGCYIISATPPFQPEDAHRLGSVPGEVVAERVPGFEAAYQQLGWRMFDRLDRVYDNRAARDALGWRPQYDFARVLQAYASGAEPWSPLAAAVGSKGYHDRTFAHGPYPVDQPGG
jgi:nucleoside-diphosphate-sugar epimerase